MTFNLPPWVPITDLVQLALLGKLQEELAELQKVAARCIMQGVDGVDPDEGTINRRELEKETADVYAAAALVMEHFQLSRARIDERIGAKVKHLRQWHAKLRDISAQPIVAGVDLAGGPDRSAWRCAVCDFSTLDRSMMEAHIDKFHVRART